MNDLHARFAAWLLEGAPGDPPRDVAVHAAACDECLARAAALDGLRLIDLDGPELPPPLPARTERPTLLAAGRWAAAAASALVLVGATALTFGGQLPAWLGQPADPDVREDVLGAASSPTARPTATATTPSPDASPTTSPTATEASTPDAEPEPAGVPGGPAVAPSAPGAPPTPIVPVGTPRPSTEATPQPSTSQPSASPSASATPSSSPPTPSPSQATPSATPTPDVTLTPEPSPTPDASPTPTDGG